jgi:hypothetical protein|tara:strand:+ start:805 stop:921 length:117 start_codon:yes stop_codon:yes gene_type:complete
MQHPRLVDDQVEGELVAGEVEALIGFASSQFGMRKFPA